MNWRGLGNAFKWWWSPLWLFGNFGVPRYFPTVFSPAIYFFFSSFLWFTSLINFFLLAVLSVSRDFTCLPVEDGMTSLCSSAQREKQTPFSIPLWYIFFFFFPWYISLFFFCLLLNCCCHTLSPPVPPPSEKTKCENKKSAIEIRKNYYK